MRIAVFQIGIERHGEKEQDAYQLSKLHFKGGDNFFDDGSELQAAEKLDGVYEG